MKRVQIECTMPMHQPYVLNGIIEITRLLINFAQTDTYYSLTVVNQPKQTFKQFNVITISVTDP